jgi:CubicO group peptidase (beta-lactamase class C family)
VNQKDQLSDLDVLKIIEPLDSVYFQPGSKWRYSNTGYCLLALIIEKVSGKNYSNYVTEKIFNVFEMRNSLVYNPEDKIRNRAYGYHLQDDKFKFADQSLTSATKGDGGVYTSAEEYLLWNSKYFQALGSISSFSIFFKNNLAPINQDISYSYGKFVGKDNLGNTVYFHSGESTGFNNFALSIPDRNIHISLFSNRDDQKIVSFIDDLLKELDIQIKGLEGKSVFNWLSSVYMNEF